ncbi:T9SS type A sorting domain-containing protein [Neolewinella persica]|uniref:T9SS type A sorting domain-containing protein n=1 Tax=Neolewinella persica TaxID=70998 RepID=UPI000376D70D|nr:T9SS type A sorting domain-containing protein [Neolewinella persica]
MKQVFLLLFLFVSTFGFSQAPTVDAPTPPVRNAVDVISIFSDTYDNITGANYNPNWNQSGFASASSSFEPTGAGGSGNVVLAYPNFNYQGIEFNSVQDITAMEFLHLDIWTVGGVAPNIVVISSGAEIPHAISNGDGAWQSIEIPVTGITGDLTKAIQFKFDGGNGSSTAIYVDNLYFWKTEAATGTDATLSALEVDGAAVAGFTPNSQSYSIELPGGTTVVPQITLATTSDASASAVITQAIAIPGDATVVVTSQDGTSTKTYTVSYYIGGPNVDAPTPPVRNAVDVISVFSDAYNNITGANYNPNWNQSGFASASSSFEPTGAGGSGNVVLAYPNFNYQGIEFNSVQDITAMEFLHLDIWTVDGVAPNITVLSSGAEIPHPIPNGDGEWQSIEIPVAGITGDLTKAIQFKFDGGNGSSTAIYVDNLYFWKSEAATGTDATLSALEVDGTAVAGFTPNSESYSIELPGGTTVVPQVTLATTSDASASAVITQATAIPGDATVVVTSQDGTTTKTYTVSYYIGAPNIDAPTPPVRNAGDVISIFSEAYDNITGANYNPNWNQSGFASASSSFEPTGAGGSGNVVLAYPNFNYQGIELNSVQDITAMEFLHLDIWTVDGVAPNVTVISSGTEIPHAIPNGDGGWQSVEIPVEGITGDLTNTIQFKFDGGNGSTTAIYIDNLYFYKGVAVGVDDFDRADFNVFPNPTNNFWNIESKQKIDLIQVFDVQGKLVTALSPNSTTASINANGLTKGIYFVKLKSAKGTKSVKLIKE